MTLLTVFLWTRQMRMRGDLDAARASVRHAEREKARALASLSREAERRAEVEACLDSQDEALAALRADGRAVRAQVAESEEQALRHLQRNSEKSDELMRLECRVMELQTQVESLTRELAAEEGAADRRENALRRMYEGALRAERARRTEVEEGLVDLEAVQDLRDRLRKLVDAIERIVADDGRAAEPAGR